MQVRAIYLYNKAEAKKVKEIINHMTQHGHRLWTKTPTPSS